jgi:transcriptional regulator with XRE-family HTH domain
MEKQVTVKEEKSEEQHSSQQINRSIGSKLRMLRTLSGKSQQDIAVALGISFQQLHKYETGVDRISAARLYQVARYLAVDVNIFFADLDDRSDEINSQEAARLQRLVNSREGVTLLQAYLDTPNDNAKKLAVNILRLGADVGGERDS